jgi:hypothetical protein
VRPASVGPDVVHEREERLVVAVVVLEHALKLDSLRLAFPVMDLPVERRAPLVQVPDESHHPVFVAEDLGLRRLGAFVAEGELHARHQEGEFPEARREDLVLERPLAEDLRVGAKRYPGARPPRIAEALELALGGAALVLVAPDAAVAADLGLEPLRERVRARDADPVQPARDLVAVLVELRPGVERGHHDLERGLPGLLVEVDRDAAAVVADRYRSVLVYLDIDALTVPLEGFVDAVVDGLVGELVQAPRAGVADVHRRSLAHGLDAVEDADVSGVVFLAHGFLSSPTEGRAGDSGWRHRRGANGGGRQEPALATFL